MAYETLHDGRCFDTVARDDIGRAEQTAVDRSGVKVPAGAFDTFKVEATSDDGSARMILWVAKDSRKAVKGQLANGPTTIAMELEP